LGLALIALLVDVHRFEDQERIRDLEQVEEPAQPFVRAPGREVERSADEPEVRDLLLRVRDRPRIEAGLLRQLLDLRGDQGQPALAGREAVLVQIADPRAARAGESDAGGDLALPPRRLVELAALALQGFLEGGDAARIAEPIDAERRDVREKEQEGRQPEPQPLAPDQLRAPHREPPAGSGPGAAGFESRIRLPVAAEPAGGESGNPGASGR